jgi:hypothetical protein
MICNIENASSFETTLSLRRHEKLSSRASKRTPDKTLFLPGPKDLCEKSFWLDDSLKQTILTQLSSNYLVQNLSDEEKKKLCVILCAIPYAEWEVEKRGNPIFRIGKILLEPFRIKNYIYTTLGTWNLHIKHARSFGLSTRKFQKKVGNDATGIFYVISYILKRIGLHKPLPIIFAEYNLKADAATVASLQKLLNTLLIKNRLQAIVVDGLVGEETVNALEICCRILGIVFSNLEEQNLPHYIEQLEEKTGQVIEPFVPAFIRKRDLSYAFFILKRSFKRPKELLKLSELFQNHIDVPAYSRYALEACEKISYDELAIIANTD